MTAKKISLDSRIYKISAVKSAIRDYAEIADIQLEKQNGALILTLENYPEDLKDTIEMEFCNYALWKLRN